MADEVFWTLLSDLTNTAINYKTSILEDMNLGILKNKNILLTYSISVILIKKLLFNPK